MDVMRQAFETEKEKQEPVGDGDIGTSEFADKARADTAESAAMSEAAQRKGGIPIEMPDADDSEFEAY
ncbi:MAG: hypothetical protein B6245_03620 [Desulfobacteraceae bacterium 4572_88]|nr:MAG: hypothetical protein B6245_03620 [Desulfobacteraceae bacterium 4572_88]